VNIAYATSLAPSDYQYNPVVGFLPAQVWLR